MNDRARNHMDCWSGDHGCYLHDENCPNGPEAKFRQHLREHADRLKREHLDADPDKACPHEHFTADVGVGRLTESGAVTAYVANVRVTCAQCSEPFVWIGVDPGSSPREPRMSIDATELRAPIRPQTAPEDFGLDGPGFDVRRVL